MDEQSNSSRERKYYETHRILYELSYREYEQATFELPGRLRGKVYALLQVYVVTIGVVPALIPSVLAEAERGHSPIFSCITLSVGFSLLLLAFYFIRDGIKLRPYDVMDSTSLRKTALEKFVDPLDLVLALEKQVSEVRDRNAVGAKELSNNIQRSYRAYFAALILLITAYIHTLF